MIPQSEARGAAERAREEDGVDWSLRQGAYALLAVVGLVVTAAYNLQFVQEQGGFSIAAFFASGYVNPAASSLTSDLAVAFAAFLVWLPGEARRVGIRHWWVYVVLSCGLAFAFAFPLFLLVRERKLAAVSG